jgi:hypothetical protein
MILTKKQKETITSCNKIIYDGKEHDCKVDIGAYGGIMVMMFRKNDKDLMEKFKYLREEEDKIAIKSIVEDTTHYLIKPNE